MVYTVASVDTRCILVDSNLESGRYISRVGRARGFLSLYSPWTARERPLEASGSSTQGRISLQLRMVKLQMSYDKPGRPHDSVSQFHDLKRFKFVLLDPFRFQLLDRSSESHSLIIIFASESESTLWFYWLPVPPLDQLSSLSQHCPRAATLAGYRGSL